MNAWERTLAGGYRTVNYCEDGWRLYHVLCDIADNHGSEEDLDKAQKMLDAHKEHCSVCPRKVEP
jgi:hypothetical protein